MRNISENSCVFFLLLLVIQQNSEKRESQEPPRNPGLITRWIEPTSLFHDLERHLPEAHADFTTQYHVLLCLPTAASTMPHT